MITPVIIAAIIPEAPPIIAPVELREYIPAEDTRKTLKVLNRQYTQYNKILIMQKNNLIALLDSCFPNANTLFSSPRRESDGHEKWVDFVLKFPHLNSVSKLCPSAFKAKYQSWCKDNHYNYSEAKAAQIHAYSRTQVSSLPMTEAVMKIIEESAKLLNSTLETLAAIRNEMDKLSSTLPEYKTVMSTLSAITLSEMLNDMIVYGKLSTSLTNIPVIVSNIFSNAKQFKLFFLFEAFVLLMCVVYYVCAKRTYQADTFAVTDEISVPVPYGQGQHGTASVARIDEIIRISQAAR